MAVYRPWLMVLAVLLMLGLGAGAAAQSADDLAVAKRLVGVWRLLETTITNADGTSRSDPRTSAYLFYSDTGTTCYVAMDPSRAPWKSETAPTPEEAVAGMAGLGAYCGTFRVDAKAGSLVLRMEIERIPNLVGRERIRSFTFQDEDHLILKIDPSEFRAPVVERRLVWERVRPRAELTVRE